MDLRGEYSIAAASRQRVWEALNDPAILARAIPGCEALTRTNPTTFEATASQKVGPVQARFRVRVRLEDLDLLTSYTLKGEGSGGAAGFAKGEAKVRLEDEGNGTRIIYDMTANVGGKLAQIGQGLVDEAAKKMAEDFFAKFSTAIVATATPGVAPLSTSDQVATASPATALAANALAGASPKAQSDASFYLLLTLLIAAIALAIALSILSPV